MQLIEAPSVIITAGIPPKLIAEYVGRLNTGDSALSIAHMISPRGRQEPGLNSVTVHVQDIDPDRGYPTTAERKKGAPVCDRIAV